MTTKKEIPAMQGKNRIRQLVTMAALAAVSIVLVFFIHFPIFPRYHFWSMIRQTFPFYCVPFCLARFPAF